MPRKGEVASTAKIERNRQVVQDYHSGLTYKQLAKKYEVNPTRIALILANHRKQHTNTLSLGE
jgi:Mor family transcriptional regulator